MKRKLPETEVYFAEPFTLCVFVCPRCARDYSFIFCNLPISLTRRAAVKSFDRIAMKRMCVTRQYPDFRRQHVGLAGSCDR